MAYENIQAEPNFYRQTFGQKGFRRIDSGFTPVTDEQYRAISMIEDSVISVTSYAGANLSAVSFPAGFTIYGLFSSVTVSSGSAIVYIA
jgi:hypothetical protein